MYVCRKVKNSQARTGHRRGTVGTNFKNRILRIDERAKSEVPGTARRARHRRPKVAPPRPMLRASCGLTAGSSGRHRLGWCDEYDGCNAEACCSSVAASRRRVEPSSHFNRTTYLESTSQESPSLLLLYHIEKTGGASVRQWLDRNVQRYVPRLDAVVEPADAVRFLCSQFHGIMGKRCRRSSSQIAVCDRHLDTPRRSEAWKNVRVAVHFGGMSALAFFVERRASSSTATCCNLRPSPTPLPAPRSSHLPLPPANRIA